MYKVIFFREKNGKEPISDYILELEKRARASKKDRVLVGKITTYIKALAAYGTRIGAPIVKHIDGDLWELRPLDNRIFFFYWRDNNFVLLHHFTKKSQKTPVAEIDKARRNLKEFLERN